LWRNLLTIEHNGSKTLLHVTLGEVAFDPFQEKPLCKALEVFPLCSSNATGGFSDCEPV
jgi:hypothetical protein